MKKLYMVLALGLGIAATAGAQSLERQVIGSAGGFDQAGGVSLSYTVGEPIVETAITGSVILTQGFQQPDDLRVGINEVTVSMDYTVYPNPTDDRLIVELKSDQLVDVQLSLFDIAGQQLINPTQVSVTGKVTKELSLKDYAAATYILVLTDKNGKQLKNFKIQKIN